MHWLLSDKVHRWETVVFYIPWSRERALPGVHLILEFVTGDASLSNICFLFITSQAHERFEEPKLEAVRENNVELVQDILKELSPLTQRSSAADELVRILKEPHFQVWKAAHIWSSNKLWL